MRTRVCPAVAFLALLPVLAVLAAGAAQGAVPVAEQVTPHTVRFFASDADRDRAKPSLCLQQPLPSLGPAPADWPVTPEFGQVQGRPTAFIAIAPGTDLYGAGEAPGSLRRDGTRTVAWNTDAYAWNAGSISLY